MKIGLLSKPYLTGVDSIMQINENNPFLERSKSVISPEHRVGNTIIEPLVIIGSDDRVRVNPNYEPYSRVGGADIFLDGLWCQPQTQAVLYWAHAAKRHLDSFIVIPLKILVQRFKKRFHRNASPRAVIEHLGLDPAEQALAGRVVR